MSNLLLKGPSICFHLFLINFLRLVCQVLAPLYPKENADNLSKIYFESVILINKNKKNKKTNSFSTNIHRYLYMNHKVFILKFISLPFLTTVTSVSSAFKFIKSLIFYGDATSTWLILVITSPNLACDEKGDDVAILTIKDPIKSSAFLTDIPRWALNAFLFIRWITF